MSDVRARRTTSTVDGSIIRPRPLGEYANGHADHHSDDEGDDEDEDGVLVDASLAVTPESSSEETGERAQVTMEERAFLKRSTPAQMLAFRQWNVDVHLLYWLIALRTLNALITSRTQFAPDEHWQSLEIAHRIVFGYGWQTWEWTDHRPATEHLFSANHWGDGPIRSVIFPALFVPVYYGLKLTGLDGSAFLLTTSPSLVQALIAATTDWYTFRLTRRILNERAAWAALLTSLCSAYAFHSFTRTLSNSAEAALTIAALFYWPLSVPEDSDSDFIGDLPLIDPSSLFKSVTLFAVSAALRPSNILLSASLVLLLLRRVVRHIRSAATALEATFSLIVLLRTTLFVALIAAISLLAVDSLYFRRLTFTPLAFLKRNVIQGISIFYGTSPFHFYLTSALPSISFTMLPFGLRGLWFAFKRPPVVTFDKPTRRWIGFRGEHDPAAVKTLADALIMFVCAMSLLSHKETRFLQPIVPILHIMQGYALVMLVPFGDARLIGRLSGRGDGESVRQTQALFRQANNDRARHAELVHSLRTFTSWQGRHHLLPRRPTWRSTMVIAKLREVVRFVSAWNGHIALVALWLNVVPIVYLSLHSSGQIRVAQYVGHLSRLSHLHSVGYLMPCHSTPWQSHMHSPELSRQHRAWFITCEPPLHLDDGVKVQDDHTIKDYRDESDDFYDDPAHFLRTRLDSTERPWPSHLVAFQALLMDHPDVDELFKERDYHVQKTFWNSLYHLDARRRGKIVLFERAKNQSGQAD